MAQPYHRAISRTFQRLGCKTRQIRRFKTQHLCNRIKFRKGLKTIEYPKFITTNHTFGSTKTTFLTCKKHLFELQKWGFYIAKVWVLFFECCVVAIRQQHYWQAVSSRRGRFIVPVYTCSPHIRKTLGHICNPFETHLCNVRNVFVICVLHIRRVKVWFLRCKSMVFGVQKLPFWLTKTTFLTCKKVGFCIFVKYISIFIDINKE